MKKRLLLLLLWLFSDTLFADTVVNVYVWGGIIPKTLVQQFERETGIKVNFSTYDNNETMYAKLRANRQSIYDVVMPSSYFVERMKKKGMLTRLMHDKLPHLSNIDPLFNNSDYDKGNHYSIPLIWGATGIFYNKQLVKLAPTNWQDLWDKRWVAQLLMLDDTRELFAIALMSLGYSPNDTSSKHIKKAYQTLLRLTPNIKLFASDSIQAVMIDEDAMLGSVWNGDAYKAHTENKDIGFVYPKDGFVIWVDCLSIPTHSPHLKEAYAFIDFMLKASSAAQIAQLEGHAIANTKGVSLLPAMVRNNPMVYPTEETLKRGIFQRDVGEDRIALYNQYWQQLKLAF